MIKQTRTVKELDKRQLKAVWNAYKDNNFQFKTANEEFTEADKFDKKRRNRIPEIKKLISRFLEGSIGLEDFKSEIDSENKQHRLWGFQGYNGQMFFNMLYNTSENEEELTNLLRSVLEVPDNKSEVESKIRSLESYIEKLRNKVEDLRRAPRLGSIPYFLSYFWHMQKRETFPIYYTSLVNVFSDLALWEPEDDLAKSYIEFWELNQSIQDFLTEYSGKVLNLWGVEHAFWYWQQRDEFEEKLATHEGPSTIPDSYIPPIVSILPDLANHTKEIEKNIGEDKSIESLLENRLYKYFQILGFEVEKLGQGRGRAPDGIAKDSRHRYAIIYDAKVRKNGYTMGVSDERKFEDYIYQNVPRLRSQGFRNIYFAVISGKFRNEAKDQIKQLKIKTDIQEVILIEANALLEILESYLRNPQLNLGPGDFQRPGIQDLFAESGLLNASKIREELEA